MEIFEELESIDNKLIKELNQIAKNKIEYWDIKSGVGFILT